MKRVLIFFTVLLLGLASEFALAVDSLVGFVDMERIDREAPQIETVRGELQKEFSERERKLLEQQAVLRKLEDRLAQVGSSMSAGERRTLERELQNRQRDAKRSQDEFREDYIIRKNEEMEDLSRLITDTIRDFARIEKYDLILVSGVVYASDASDVTGRVIDRLKGQHQEKINDIK
jgi:outer membrane protein